MNKDYKKQTRQLVKKIQDIAHGQKKATGFCIGNTSKIDSNGLYFTPLRIMPQMVLSGVVVYSERKAMEVASLVDGEVDYILIDAEKKIPLHMSRSGDYANVERAVREVVRKSTIWVYKGNDLAVDAIDCILTYLTKDYLRGLGGRKVAILGAGNLGCKLALKLVERGANVIITRRNARMLRTVVQGLNYIKPTSTLARIVGMSDNEKATRKADVLIGLTQGIPVITSNMIRNLSRGALVIDGGKGTLYPEAIKLAHEMQIDIYRLDISAALEGLVHGLFKIEDIVENRLGRRVFYDEPVVSGGLLAKRGEFVVDNVYAPKVVYGMANGKGDFIRQLSKKQKLRLKRIQKLIDK